MRSVLTKGHRFGVTGTLLALTLGLVACGSQAPLPEAVTGEAVEAAQGAGVEDLGAQQIDPGNNNLSVEPFMSVTNAWGPVERDRSNGEQAAGDGRALTLNGQVYSRGFGTHAGSSMTFDLRGLCSTFTASVGVDDEVGTKGSVVFQVYADGTKLYESGKMTGSSATKSLSVPVTGKKELKLVVTDMGDGNTYDHADWVNPTLLNCAAPAPSQPVYSAPVYSAPLTITRGGIYSGNWESTTTTPVITIQTSEPVVIENSTIRGQGVLVHGFGVDLTLRNVRGQSVRPNVAGRAAEMAIKVEEIRNLRVENSSFDRGGIYVRKFVGSAAAGQSIRILRNTFSNLDGRQSDGAGGYNGSASFRQMVQFNDVTRIVNAEIAWNQVVNKPGDSSVEDNINMYASSGTPESPILIHDNYIQGAYPANPASTSYSGGGIMLGDAKVTDPLNNGYMKAYNNQIVSTTNYGLAIAGGSRVEAYGNRIVSSGRLPDGSRIPAQNVGIYVWDIYGAGGLTPPTFANNSLHDNQSGWTKVNTDGTTSDNHMWLPDCSSQGTTCPNNTSLGTQTLASEKAEWDRWQAKLSGAGVVIGAR